MFIRRECSGIDIEVRIDFDGRYSNTDRLQYDAQTTGDNAFAHTADHAASDQNVLHSETAKRRRFSGVFYESSKSDQQTKPAKTHAKNQIKSNQPKNQNQTDQTHVPVQPKEHG